MIFVFDFDSTVFPFESLEDLIAQTQKDENQRRKITEQMSAISDLAMNGDLDFLTSLSQRIQLTQLNQTDIKQYCELREDAFDTQITKIIQNLKCSHSIYFVSGGFKDYLTPLIEKNFQIQAKAIYANEFSYTGKVVNGFDEANLLTKSDGKVSVVKQIKAKHPNQKMVMIGDGYTDLLVFTAGIADYFIAAGYYKKRDKVIKQIQSMNKPEAQIANSVGELKAIINQLQTKIQLH